MLAGSTLCIASRSQIKLRTIRNVAASFSTTNPPATGHSNERIKEVHANIVNKSNRIVSPWMLANVPDPDIVIKNPSDIASLDRAHDPQKHRTVTIGQKCVSVMGSATHKYKPWYITWGHEVS